MARVRQDGRLLRPAGRGAPGSGGQPVDGTDVPREPEVGERREVPAFPKTLAVSTISRTLPSPSTTPSPKFATWLGRRLASAWSSWALPPGFWVVPLRMASSWVWTLKYTST